MAKKRINALTEDTTKEIEGLTLTPQQLLFCQEYVKDMNGTKAAIRAGYAEKSAVNQASRLLTNEYICSQIKQLMEDRLQAARVDKDLVLGELVRIAKSDVRKLFDDNGGLLPPSQWPDDMAGAVASVEVDEIFQGYGEDREHIGYTKKVKLWKKEKALELLGKNLSLFIEKVEVSGKISLEDLISMAGKGE